MPTRSSIAAAGCFVAAALLAAPMLRGRVELPAPASSADETVIDRCFSAAITISSFSYAAASNPTRPLTGQKPAAAPAAPAFRIIELPSGRTLSAGREDLLGTPVLPGSIIKVATLVAALDSGVIGPDTRMLCPREVVIDGRRVSCSHPDVRRPIGPAEALAHSCNGYFAAVAGRLRREALDRALVQLGLPPTLPSVSLASAAVGIDGARIPADRLLSAFVRLTTGTSGVGAETRRVVFDGLRGAAEYGTAVAFSERGISALAKTGTAAMPGGGFEGLLVAVTPAQAPTKAVVVMAPGGAGFDAARIAAELLRPAGSVVRVGMATRGGYDVTTMGLEEYVARVVSAEAAAGSGLEARKALAIAVRTFAVRNRGRHADEGFDLCDLTHCQVVGVRTKGGEEAAAATSGQLLFAAGSPAEVYYTASCGGHSERPSSVWPKAADPAFLPARPEPECRGDQVWQTDVSATDLQRALIASGRRGQSLRELVVRARTSSGRVSRMGAEGFDPSEISGEDFRLAVGRTLGWQLLKSTLFDVERTATGYRFRGRGRGHGVGLCVLGSARLAASGRSAQEILARYFPGTEIRPGTPDRGPNDKTAIEIAVPVGEERERVRIEGLSRAALREFSAKTGVPPPQRVQLVFHPSVDAYLRASGKPWWTAGAANGSRIDFIPLSALRDRGLLERTLRHELAHVVTRERLAGRPIWVQEAVAMDVSGDPRIVSARQAAPGAGASGRGAGSSAPRSCPTDAEWDGIRSADALEKAYTRAAACFVAQTRAGRRWDEVR
jgi:stage II sporulation protein D